MPPMDADELVEGCGRAVAGTLGELLGDDLVAAYLIGSGALGGVSAVQSDVDVVAVCAAPPARGGRAGPGRPALRAGHDLAAAGPGVRALHPGGGRRPGPGAGLGAEP